MMKQAATEIAKVIRKYHLNYDQTKDVFKLARKECNLANPRRRKGTVPRLTAEEERRFLETAYQKAGKTGLMLKTLLESGTRNSEFCNLRVDDISYEERLVVVRSGKGDKRREVPITDGLAQLLRVYVGDRETGYLFESRLNDKFTPRRIQQIVRETAEAAGIDKAITPHKLRHTIATYLLNNGMSIDQVQRFLGHDNVATTQIYAQTETATMRKGFDQATQNRV